MVRRALLVGSQIHRLRATMNDLTVMGAALRAHAFECEVVGGSSATRAAILAAYRGLIAASKEGDAAVFYFSGHGGHFPNPLYSPLSPCAEARYHRFIVPVDIEESTDCDFRGITNHELAFLLDELRVRTENVTVLLDCCHAALMSRGAPELVPKALASPWLRGIDAHIEQLRGLGIDTTSEGRRLVAAVGVGACGASASAYEREVAPGHWLSLLTQFLAAALDGAANAPNMDWQRLVSAVRERVQNCHPLQRPSVEGKARRLLFDLREADAGGTLPLVRRGGGFELAGGHLHGVRLDDRYAVVELDPAGSGEERRIAGARVTAVRTATSSVELTFPGPPVELPGDATARPVAQGAPTLPIVLDPSFSARREWVAVVRAADHLVFDDGDATAVRLSRAGDALRATDARGVPCFASRPDSEGGLAATLENLRALARARALLRLADGGQALLAPEALVWGTVDGGVETPLSRHGVEITLRQRIFVRLKNDSERTLWVSLIDIGVAADRTLLNAYFAPDGVELEPGDTYVLGEHAGVLEGVPLSWPTGLDREHPRLETLLAVVTPAPLDLRPLEGAGARGATEGSRSRFRARLDYIERGVVADEDEPSDSDYQVMSLSFMLDPAPVNRTSIAGAERE